MGTFKSWLIANLEIIYYLALGLIILGVALFGHFGADEWFAVILLSVVLFIISVASIKHGFGILIFLIFVVGLPLLSSVLESGHFASVYSFFKCHFTFLLIAFVVAVVVGILIAIYAYRNFDDVVSMRFLYRNSEVSVFEQAWKYAFNRQFAGFMLVFGLALEILLLVGIKEVGGDIIPDNPFTQKREEVVTKEATSVKELEREKIEKSFPSVFTLDGYLSGESKEYPIEMFLNVSDVNQEEAAVKGFYRYKSQAKNKRIGLSGTCQPGRGTIRLVSDGGTERFDIKYDQEYGIVKGFWTQFETLEDQEADAVDYKNKLEVFAKNQ